MIGNDIVDLAFAAQTSNWRRPRFLKKIFTESEQRLISNSKLKNQIVWQLWSMKEAAYKCYLQDSGEPFYNPAKIICQPSSTFFRADSLKNGAVTIFEKTYITLSEITDRYIHTIAFSNLAQNIKKDAFSISAENHLQQSEEVKNKLFNFLKNTNSYYEKISVAKDRKGAPRLFSKGILIKISLSLSHHGNFGAYAIC